MKGSEYIDNMIEDLGYVECEQCGITQGSNFHVHHIVYRSEAPKHKNLHHENNLILLCEGCHNWYHNKKDRRKPLVRLRGLKKLFDGVDSL